MSADGVLSWACVAGSIVAMAIAAVRMTPGAAADPTAYVGVAITLLVLAMVLLNGSRK